MVTGTWLMQASAGTLHSLFSKPFSFEKKTQSTCLLTWKHTTYLNQSCWGRLLNLITSSKGWEYEWQVNSCSELAKIAGKCFLIGRMIKHLLVTEELEEWVSPGVFLHYKDQEELICQRTAIISHQPSHSEGSGRVLTLQGVTNLFSLTPIKEMNTNKH